MHRNIAAIVLTAGLLMCSAPLMAQAETAPDTVEVKAATAEAAFTVQKAVTVETIKTPVTAVKAQQKKMPEKKKKSGNIYVNLLIIFVAAGIAMMLLPLIRKRIKGFEGFGKGGFGSYSRGSGAGRSW